MSSPVLDLLVALVELVTKVSLIIVVARLGANAIRRRFPSGAHLLWVLAFVAILGLPIASAWMPGKSVLFLNLIHYRPTVGRQIKDTSQPGAVKPNAQQAVVPGASGADAELQQPASQTTDPLTLLKQSPPLLGAVLLWLIGFLAVCARWIHGLYCLRIIRRFGTNSPTSEAHVLEAERLAKEAGLSRPFDLRICATTELPVPMTWGIFRPTIMLPLGAESWSEKRFEATLLHELAHAHRFDFLTQMLAEVACALYWFNPLVWMGARTMRSDAELAADEAALHAGLKPSDYANELLLLASDLGRRPVPFASLGTPAMTNSKIETRLESILSPAAGRRGVTTIQVLATIALAIVVVPTFASFHASTLGQSTGDSGAERVEARNRAKQIGLATLMYSLDYDNEFPYVQQTASAVEVLQPYMKSYDVFQSPTKGGKFNFNMNIAGVATTAIEFPSQTPTWVESLPDPKMQVAVAYADGHARLVDPSAPIRPEDASRTGLFAGHAPSNMSALKAAASLRFPRASKMKPLPPNYLLPAKP